MNRILILTGIKEELAPLLEKRSFDFDKSYRCWRSRESRNIFAATTGPGLSKKKEIRKLLESLQPEVVINAGLVGSLDRSDPFVPGDEVAIGSITDSRYGTIFPAFRGNVNLVTVDRILNEPWERQEVASDFNAKVCDMESSKLISMIGAMEHYSKVATIVVIKVVGDRPGDHRLFQAESMIREWDKKSMVEKIRTSFQFPGGPWGLVRLRRMKRKSLSRLLYLMESRVASINRTGSVPSTIPGVFVPH